MSTCAQCGRPIAPTEIVGCAGDAGVVSGAPQVLCGRCATPYTIADALRDAKLQIEIEANVEPPCPFDMDRLQKMYEHMKARNDRRDAAVSREIDRQLEHAFPVPVRVSVETQLREMGVKW